LIKVFFHSHLKYTNIFSSVWARASPSTTISQIDTTTGKGGPKCRLWAAFCFVFFYFNFYFNWNNIIPRSSHELTTKRPSKDLLMEFVCLARYGFLLGYIGFRFVSLPRVWAWASVWVSCAVPANPITMRPS